MLHAYCVRRAGDAPPPAALRGVGDAPVHLVEAAGVGLWLSPRVEGPASVDRLREHNRVVHQALRSATPLPIRFGAGSFAGEEEARAAITEGREGFLASLDRVAGQVEMGIRVGWRDPTPPVERPGPIGGRAHSGREYLELRRAEWEAERAREGVAGEALDRVVEALAGAVLSTVRTVVADGAVAGTLALLVRRGDVARFRESAARARDSLPEYDLTLSGPWAPYSFS